jgi:hypothetical protein
MRPLVTVASLKTENSCKEDLQDSRDTAVDGIL